MGGGGGCDSRGMSSCARLFDRAVAGATEAELGAGQTMAGPMWILIDIHKFGR